MHGVEALRLFLREADFLQTQDREAFPLQAVATGPITRAALEQGRDDLVLVLAGQGVSLARDLGAADLVAALVAETETALSGLR